MEYPIEFLGNHLDYQIFHCHEIDSTNSYFKRHGTQFSCPSVLIADHQSKGRGRYIRKWQDNKDDLLFSFIVKDDVRYEILSPLAILQATRKYHINTFIKWPNDIYVEDKKLSGILIENIFRESKLCFQIVGIGINFHKKEELASIGIHDINPSVDKMDLLKYFLSSLNELKRIPLEEAINKYKKNNLIYHRKIQYQNKSYQVIDFTSEGYLVVENEQERRIIKSDEIDIKNCLEERI